MTYETICVRLLPVLLEDMGLCVCKTEIHPNRNPEPTSWQKGLEPRFAHAEMAALYETMSLGFGAFSVLGLWVCSFGFYTELGPLAKKLKF